jgi:hypothetical protein
VEHKQTSEEAAKQCDSKPEQGVSAREAARVLSEWVVVPKDLWFNHFSHTGMGPPYNRVLQLRQTDGKNFVLEVEPYGTGMVVFENGGAAYLVSPCNAAAIEPKSSEAALSLQR